MVIGRNVCVYLAWTIKGLRSFDNCQSFSVIFSCQSFSVIFNCQSFSVIFNCQSFSVIFNKHQLMTETVNTSISIV